MSSVELKYNRICEPISSAILILEEMGFTIKEQKLSNFHFKEFYFLMSGEISKISGLPFNGINRVEDKLELYSYSGGARIKVVGVSWNSWYL